MRRSIESDSGKMNLHRRVSLLRRSEAGSMGSGSILNDDTDADWNKIESQWWKRLDKDQDRISGNFFPPNRSNLDNMEISIEESHTIRISLVEDAESEEFSVDSVNSLPTMSPIGFVKKEGLFKNKVKNASGRKTRKSQLQPVSLPLAIAYQEEEKKNESKDVEAQQIPPQSQSNGKFDEHDESDRDSNFDSLHLRSQINSQEETNARARSKTLFKNKRRVEKLTFSQAVDSSTKALDDSETVNENQTISQLKKQKSKKLFKKSTNLKHSLFADALSNLDSDSSQIAEDTKLRTLPIKTPDVVEKVRHTSDLIGRSDLKLTEINKVQTSQERSSKAADDSETVNENQSELRLKKQINPSKKLFKKSTNLRNSLFADALSHLDSDNSQTAEDAELLVLPEKNSNVLEKDLRTSDSTRSKKLRVSQENKNVSRRRISESESVNHEFSPSSVISETINFDKWKQLASSTILDGERTPKVANKSHFIGSKQLLTTKLDMLHSGIVEEKETDDTNTPKILEEAIQTIPLARVRENSILEFGMQCDNNSALKNQSELCRGSKVSSSPETNMPEVVRNMKTFTNISEIYDFGLPNNNETSHLEAPILQQNYSKLVKRQSIGTWLKLQESDEVSSPPLSQSDIDQQVINELMAKRTNPPVRRSTHFDNQRINNTTLENDSSEAEIQPVKDSIIPHFDTIVDNHLGNDLNNSSAKDVNTRFVTKHIQEQSSENSNDHAIISEIQLVTEPIIENMPNIQPDILNNKHLVKEPSVNNISDAPSDVQNITPEMQLVLELDNQSMSNVQTLNNSTRELNIQNTSSYNLSNNTPDMQLVLELDNQSVMSNVQTVERNIIIEPNSQIDLIADTTTSKVLFSKESDNHSISKTQTADKNLTKELKAQHILVDHSVDIPPEIQLVIDGKNISHDHTAGNIYEVQHAKENMAQNSITETTDNEIIIEKPNENKPALQNTLNVQNNLIMESKSTNTKKCKANISIEKHPQNEQVLSPTKVQLQLTGVTYSKTQTVQNQMVNDDNVDSEGNDHIEMLSSELEPNNTPQQKSVKQPTSDLFLSGSQDFNNSTNASRKTLYSKGRISEIQSESVNSTNISTRNSSTEPSGSINQESLSIFEKGPEVSNKTATLEEGSISPTSEEENDNTSVEGAGDWASSVTEMDTVDDDSLSTTNGSKVSHITTAAEIMTPDSIFISNNVSTRSMITNKNNEMKFSKPNPPTKRKLDEGVLEKLANEVMLENTKRAKKVDERFKNRLDVKFRIPCVGQKIEKPVQRKQKPIIGEVNILPKARVAKHKLEEKVLKKPKLYMKEQWITQKLYHFVEKKLKPKYGLKSLMKSEKFIKHLATIVNVVMKSKKDYNEYVNVLKMEMARMELIVTYYDFCHFIHEFLPFQFRVKSIPAEGRDVPEFKGKVFSPILRKNN